MIETMFKSKLPRWAEKKMEALQRERDNAVEQLQQFMDNQTESNIFARGNALSFQDRNYIQSDEVTFLLPKSEVSVRIDGDGLRIMACGIKSMLTIRPHVTNVIVVTPTD